MMGFDSWKTTAPEDDSYLVEGEEDGECEPDYAAVCRQGGSSICATE